MGRGQVENGVKVAMRNQKGTYQASCLKGVEEKELSSKRATGKSASSGESTVSI